MSIKTKHLSANRSKN